MKARGRMDRKGGDKDELLEKETRRLTCYGGKEGREEEGGERWKEERE